MARVCALVGDGALRNTAFFHPVWVGEVVCFTLLAHCILILYVLWYIKRRDHGIIE